MVSISYSSPVASDTANAPIQVAIPQGQTSVDVTITIPQDGVYQALPRTLQISAPSGLITSDTLSFQIVNTDPFPNIQVAGSPSLEGSTAVVNVTLDAPIADDLELNYSLSPNTASASSYVGTNGTVEIPAGSLSGTLSVPLNTNGSCDGTTDFIVTVTPPSDSTQGPVSFQQDILENTPVVYSLNSTSVVEGTSGNLTLTSDLSCSFSRTLSFSSTDGAAVAGTNYNALVSQTVTLPASQTSVSVPFQTLNDLIQSPTKDFSISMAAASYGTVAGSGTVQITDTNPTPTLTWTAATKSITRSSTTTTIAWSLSKASGYDIQATVLLSGTATRGTDYEVSSTALTIPAGTASGSFEVQVFASTVYDGDRTVILTLDSMTHAASGAILTHTLTLADTVPTISISGTASLTEGASGNYTVTLSKASTSTITVDYSTQDGTATSSTDYTTNAATLTFAPSEQNKSVTISTLDNATVCQANRTFSVFISNPSGATLSTTSSASTVIQDDDYPTLSSVDFSVSESSASANFTATLPQACGYNVQYSWTTVNGTAVAGTDYFAANGTVLIPAGTLSITRSITLKDDNIDQGNRYFYVQFSNPTKVVLPSSSTKITITDDELPPTLSFNQSSATALDSVGSFSVTATLSHPTTQAVTAALSLSGTAVYNQDYTASSLSVSIPAGSTSQTITLFPVRGTGGKTIGLTLGAPNHGSLNSPSTFTLTLQEDPFVGPLIASSTDSSLILYLSRLSNGSSVPLSLGTTTTSAGVRVSKAPGASPKITSFGFSGDQQRALFLGNNNRASDLDLFSVRTDGSLLTQLNSAGWVSGRSVQKFRTVGTTAKVILLADRVSGGATADLYAVNTDSSALQNLVPSVNGTKTIFDFDITPSGTKVVFLSDLQGVREIYSVSPDGSGLVKLNTNLAAGSTVDQFAITPDSSKVVFTVKDSSGKSALYVAPIGSGSQTLLNQLVGGRTVKSFKISPDSAKVAYVHNYTSLSNFDLFNININGSSRIQINQNLVSGGSVTDYGFAPNSSKLYFLAEAQVLSSPELYTANLDGTSLAKLSATLPSGGRIDRAAFTPNSSLVIYLGHQDSASTQELYSVSATGSGRVKLSLTPVSGGQITQFLITKDSSKVVYLGDQEDLGVAEVFVVNTNGSQLMCISSTALVSGKKADSIFLPPNSLRVLYRANQDDSSRYDWYSVNLDGGMLTKAFAP